MICRNLIPVVGRNWQRPHSPFATALARHTGATLMRMRASHYHSLYADVASGQAGVIANAEHYLADVAGPLARHGLRVESASPFDDSTSKWIVAETELRQADLVVMATHALADADHWLHGNVVESVVHKWRLPVMLVHANAAQSLGIKLEHSATAAP